MMPACFSEGDFVAVSELSSAVREVQLKSSEMFLHFLFCALKRIKLSGCEGFKLLYFRFRCFSVRTVILCIDCHIGLTLVMIVR
jgi:hypothetical protein